MERLIARLNICTYMYDIYLYIFIHGVYNHIQPVTVQPPYLQYLLEKSGGRWGCLP